MKMDPRPAFQLLTLLLRALAKVKDGLLARWLW